MRHRIPSLDGLRAVAVALVLVGHLNGAAFSLPAWLAAWLGNSEAGVYVFFVISGYLITGLLRDEQSQRGAIRIGRFYRRRAWRIFPAFYAMLAVLAVLACRGVIPVRGAEFAVAALYVWNIAPGATWYLGHVWSLCIEEQFYLIWPPLLARLRAAAAARLALAVVLLDPLLRVAAYFALPAWRGRIPILLPTRADALLFGALLALWQGHVWFERGLAVCFRRRAHFLAAAFLFTLHPWLTARWRGGYSLTVGWSLEGLAIALLVAWLVRLPGTWPGRVLNSSPLVHVGRISYSVYLWQQLFLASPQQRFHVGFPLDLLLIALAAEASYYGVERPFLRWRDRRAARPAAAAARG